MTDEVKAEKYADWFWGASPSARRAIKQGSFVSKGAGQHDSMVVVFQGKE